MVISTKVQVKNHDTPFLISGVGCLFDSPNYINFLCIYVCIYVLISETKLTNGQINPLLE